MGKDTSLLRKIPAVQTLLEDPAAKPLLTTHGHGEVVAALRKILDHLRVEAGAGRRMDVNPAGILARAAAVLAPPARKVINATGVLIHTHLGRSPLPPGPVELLSGYMNLEISLADGSRGIRNALCEEMLTRFTGAEAALVVNNNAAALILMLSAFAKGGEVLISRGELVEIGGSFRIPEILAQSGCALREVGTTNRTTLNDYMGAVTPQTRGILKVHPSNFRIQGFTEGVGARDLAAAAREKGLPLWVDQGCGLVRALPGFDFHGEEPVEELVRAGADLVCFSGDKLLGGPQAGVAVGRKGLIRAMLAHPLYRALRPGKETYIFLQQTLKAHLAGKWDEIPLWKMALIPLGELQGRARRMKKLLAPLAVEAAAAASRFGGGTTPLLEFPSAALKWPVNGPTRVLARLLALPVPVLACIKDEALLFNLRTVFPEEDARLVEAIREVAAM